MRPCLASRQHVQKRKTRQGGLNHPTHHTNTHSLPPSTRRQQPQQAPHHPSIHPPVAELRVSVTHGMKEEAGALSPGMPLGGRGMGM
mmetsp:Transcript_32997/g.81727  ORF Transcript_32997/g.81727 Transcript_32997/m.81727 type:complete len:87 (-) Transcript_32997:432-692(-)